MGMRRFFFMMVALVLLAGCGAPAADTNEVVVMSTPRPPMTLAPTYTPPPTPGPLPTLTPPLARETAVPNTPIAFDETVLELRYQIPLLGLNRRLQGNKASQIIVVDETTGRSIQRNNEGGVMFELRQALSGIELAPLPEGCAGCVYVEYELTDAGISGSGWLQEPVLLASVENFMSATLGPHLPEGTVIGLRRSASPFAPAHILALTEDGRLWTWLATEAAVSEPVASEASPDLLAQLAQIPLADLAEGYVADCRGVPLETLVLKQGDVSWTGRLVCPELSLPTTLQPLYVQLDALLAEKTAVATTSLPPAAFPLNGLLHYTRPDKSQLTLLANSTLIASDALGTLITTTLTSTEAVSLTTSLLESGLLKPGFETFIVSSKPVSGTVTAEPTASTLAVRGPNGVYDAKWLTLPNNEAIRFLNTLLDTILKPEPTPLPS